MKDKLISFETAKLAKEKGFNFTTNEVYNIKRNIKLGLAMPCDSIASWQERVNLKLVYKPPVSVPTQSLLQKWLREKHNLHVWVTYHYPKNQTGYTRLFNVKYVYVLMFKSNNKRRYNSYEDALETGLQEALKLIEKSVDVSSFGDPVEWQKKEREDRKID